MEQIDKYENIAAKVDSITELADKLNVIKISDLQNNLTNLKVKAALINTICGGKYSSSLKEMNVSKNDLKNCEDTKSYNSVYFNLVKGNKKYKPAKKSGSHNKGMKLYNGEWISQSDFDRLENGGKLHNKNKKVKKVKTIRHGATGDVEVRNGSVNFGSNSYNNSNMSAGDFAKSLINK
jgi:hypothetical protein